MNKYLILLHHYFGSDTGVMTIVIKASTKETALEYVDKQFAFPLNWLVQSVTLIGIDTHA